MPNHEPTPDPDEFGQIPKHEEGATEPDSEHLFNLPEGFMDQIRNNTEPVEPFSLNLNDYILEPPSEEITDNYHPPHISLSDLYGSIGRHREQSRRDYLSSYLHDMPEEMGSISGNGIFGGHLFIMRPEPEPAEQEPVEQPDPYPSREGWREEFVPPHDPLVEDKKEERTGTIGGFDIITTATTFYDVGGNAIAKDVLIEVANQFEDPDLYDRWDVPVPKGVLLKGDPGTGKTMIAKAFANRADAAFVEIPVAGLRDKYYGETEKALKGIYDEAAKYPGRVVLFFDEIDSLLGDRKGLPPSHPDVQLVNAALQAMDGMQSASNVMTLGATNYPEKLDSAAIRPGRFDRKVAVELPDREACGEIAAKRLLSAERSTQSILVEDELNIDEISGYLEGLSGADITEVVNRVKRTMAQTERSKQSQIEIDGVETVSFDDGSDDIRITTDDIIATAINYRLQG